MYYICCIIINEILSINKRQIYDMKFKKVKREIKYPENLKINSKLQKGDRVKIAKGANLKPGTVRDQMLGYLRITDNVAREIIKIIREREELNKQLEAITNQ